MSAKKKKPKTLAKVFSEDCEKPGTSAWFDMVRERYGKLLKMDGYDDCIIGVTTQFNRTTILYDQEKVIKKLSREFAPEAYGQHPDEMAQEWFDFNIIGAWMGDTTPSFFTKS